MHASSGTGGYCDCGDVEAWSKDPACNKHKEGLNVDEASVSFFYNIAFIAHLFCLIFCLYIISYETSINKKNSVSTIITHFF